MLVDKDQNLYLIDQAIKKDFSFSIVLIHEVVLLEAVKEVQFASAIINSDYEKITINEFKLLIDQYAIIINKTNIIHFFRSFLLFSIIITPFL